MDKPALRQKLLSARLAIPPPQRDAMNAALVAHLKAWLAARCPDLVALFHPVRGEPDVLPVARELPGLAFALPVVGEEPGAMTFHAYLPGDPLKKSRLGIMEPALSAPRVRLTASSVVVVPAVAVDRHGARLGYGGGFYDRLLAGFSGTAVGAVFQSMMVERLPVQPHDVHLAYVVTEDGVVRSEIP